jgi:hypothetical protein
MDGQDNYKIEPLKGSANYRTWKFSVKMVLQAKDLWEIVSGVEVKPEVETEGVAWEKRARKALAVISLTLTAAEQEHVIDCTTPKAAWDILEKLYEGKGRNRKFMLLQELFRESLRNGNMDGYLRSVKEKLSELSRIGTKLEKDVQLAIVLNGLTDEYRYLIVALESQDLDKIDFDELTARLLEEEKKLNPIGISNLQTAMKATRTGNKSECNYCHETGHWKKDCPALKEKEKTRSTAKFAM